VGFVTDDSSTPESSIDRQAALSFVHTLGNPQLTLVKLAAERFMPDAAPTTNYVHQLGFAYQDAAVYYRHEVEATMIAEDGSTQVAKVTATVLAAFQLVAEALEPPSAVVEFFGDTSVPLITTPFLREVISTTASRLGILGVSLPLALARIDPELILTSKSLTVSH
jgi:hypothetical protein